MSTSNIVPQTGGSLCHTIWLARHGLRLEPVPKPHLPYDCPITTQGHDQAQALAESLVERLAEASIAHIFCSPFRRTIESVRPLAQALNLPIKLEWGLEEILDPRWLKSPPELPSVAERQQEFPEVALDYKSLVIPDYPETEDQHQQRIGKTIDLLIQNYGPTLFLMTHGAPSQAMRRWLLKRNEVFNIDYCSLSQLVRCGDEWTYAVDADCSHLHSRGLYAPGDGNSVVTV